ncbi:hypothetical protein ABZ532_05700 [Streptomyces sp. NPDC019396]|uniref:TRADD-N-associated membrane domain-containing protein n=1 Tax=Streptomyces sp. NPDC019396 TaxID=3154687 RepID=UPI0033DCF05A
MGIELLLPVVMAVAGTAATSIASLLRKRLASEADSEGKRLRAILREDAGEAATGQVSGLPSDERGGINTLPSAGTQRVDDDRFAQVLIEYYAWGLTQARSATVLSLTCSALGVLVLLAGVAMGIIRAESTGELYAAAATSTSGAVAAVIGHLAHRRADKAMEHMRLQTESLRADMRRERELEASIRLIGEVEEPLLRSQLQAAVVLKLASAEVPDLPAWSMPEPKNSALSRQAPSRNGTGSV